MPQPEESTALVKVTYDTKLARLSKPDEVKLAELIGSIQEAVKQLRAIEITTDEEDAMVAASLKPLRKVIGAVKKLFENREAKYKEPLKALQARRKSIIDPWEDTKKLAERKSSEYLTERAARLAREREEQQRKQEEQQRQLQEAAAREAEQRGDKAAAEQIRDMPVCVPPPPELPPVKVDGATVRVDFEYAVQNWSEFIRFVSLQPHHIIPTIVQVRDEWVKARLKQYGDIQIPGIVVRRVQRRIGSR